MDGAPVLTLAIDTWVESRFGYGEECTARATDDWLSLNFESLFLKSGGSGDMLLPATSTAHKCQTIVDCFCAMAWRLGEMADGHVLA